jgi:hypothetical protein
MSLHANGSASFSTASLGVGTHSISARFNANSVFTGSSSTPITLVVQAAPAGAIPTFAALSAMLHPENGTVAFRLTVAAEHGSPQSTVVFLDGGIILGKVMTDSSGIAILTMPLPGNGPHNFQGSFSGDSQFAPSVSPELQELWPDSGPGFSLVVDPGIVRLNGTAAETEITTATASAVQDPLQLACVSGLPTGYSCSFDPASLPPGGTSRLSIHAPVVSRNVVPYTRQHRINTLLTALMLAAVFAVGLLVFPRRRIPALLALLCCLSLSALSGCGGTTQPHQQVAVVTIQATSGTGQSHGVHSAQFIFMISNR